MLVVGTPSQRSIFFYLKKIQCVNSHPPTFPFLPCLLLCARELQRSIQFVHGKMTPCRSIHVLNQNIHCFDLYTLLFVHEYYIVRGCFLVPTVLQRSVIPGYARIYGERGWGGQKKCSIKQFYTTSPQCIAVLALRTG